jgi:DNA-damage-inducible protein J
MKQILVSIRLDKDLKDEAASLFDELGLSLSGAINIFLKQSVREGKIPFEIKRGKTAGRKIKPLHQDKIKQLKK